MANQSAEDFEMNPDNDFGMDSDDVATEIIPWNWETQTPIVGDDAIPVDSTVEGYHNDNSNSSDNNSEKGKSEEEVSEEEFRIMGPDVPNPRELQDMLEEHLYVAEGNKNVVQVLGGPMCWKCYERGTFFDCKNCGRHFHRECAFMMGPGFPAPLFDKSANEACSAEWGEVNMLKCSNCLVSEETRIAQLRNVSREELNQALYRLTKFIEKEKAGNLLSKFPLDDPHAISVQQIAAKASAGAYKSVEGYYGDFKMILYNLTSKHAVQSEATLTASIVLGVVGLELQSLIACIECKYRSFDVTGRLQNSKDYGRIIRLPCRVPHVVLWEKERSYGYWPAKVLTHDKERKVLIIQCFGQRAGTREIPFPSGDFDFKVFSREYPLGQKPKQDMWKHALTDCRMYLSEMKAKFGEDGVIIPMLAEPFDGDLEKATRKMFPLYVPQ